ncbi:hypothetical protein JOQ06_003525 [Pogonophryne albipinna]|uniref:Uncharacterized protein n=1 Tax=Pogonophryne albipinna TaxID=1090488 RepID=A0AAD6F8G4_9TELE|nr:hypothetical protein JOQ06_003525 [Pogonophryne albipinna]
MMSQSTSQHHHDITWNFCTMLTCRDVAMATVKMHSGYSLTEEGLALGERLESLEGTKGPEGDREEARSEGNEQEEGEEGGTGIVDLTVSDDDEEEKEEERIQPTERPTSSASQPRVLVPGMFFSGKPQNVPSRNPNSWKSPSRLLRDHPLSEAKTCKQDLVKELQRNGSDVRCEGEAQRGRCPVVAREKVAPIPGNPT